MVLPSLEYFNQATIMRQLAINLQPLKLCNIYIAVLINQQNNTEHRLTKSLETVISIIQNIYLNIFYFLCEFLYYTYAQSNNLQIQRIL